MNISPWKTREIAYATTIKHDKNQIFICPETVRLICISPVKKCHSKWLKWRLLAFTQLHRRFFPRVNSVVDNGLLHTGPRNNQTLVRYTNK